MTGLRDLKAEMGIKQRHKEDSRIGMYVRLELDVAKELVKLADQQRISVARCAADLITRALIALIKK